MMRGCCRKVALSVEAKKAYKKAQRAHKKRRRNTHWFFIRKGDSKKEVFSKVFTQLAAVTLLVCVVVLFDYFKASFDNSKLNNTLQDLYGKFDILSISSGKLLPSAEKLLEINPDTIGWVKIDDTKIDLPVVLKKDDDKEHFYYLTHNFEGKKAKAGALFVDYRTTITFASVVD